MDLRTPSPWLQKEKMFGGTGRDGDTGTDDRGAGAGGAGSGGGGGKEEDCHDIALTGVTIATVAVTGFEKRLQPKPHYVRSHPHICSISCRRLLPWMASPEAAETWC